MSTIKPKIQYKNIVDDQTVEDICHGQPKTSQKETLRMLSDSIDKMDSKDPARKAYEKVYDGAKKYF